MALIDTLGWGLAAGVLARVLLPGIKPGPLVTWLAGVSGCVVAFLVAHEVLGSHEFHLFQPEGLLPGVAGSLGLLLAARAMRRTTRRRRTIFS